MKRRRMEFRDNIPIFIQIAETIYEQILRKVWSEEERIPSVREMAIQLEVNPNTVQRTYAYLQEKGIIKNKRGIGYFIAEGAYESALDIKKIDFIEKACPHIFKTMDLLKISFKDLREIHARQKSSIK